MKKSPFLLLSAVLGLAGSLNAQTVLPASFDTCFDFWQGVYNSSLQNAGNNILASNSGIAPQATEDKYYTEYDPIGVVVQFDLSGLTPGEVNAPDFQAVLDMMFAGFVADYNIYETPNPDPGPNPGARDGYVYLDVHRITDSYTNTANRWLKKSNWSSSDKTFVNWDDSSYTLEAAEILAPGGTDVLTAPATNFNESTMTGPDLAVPAEDQIALVAVEPIVADLTSSARIQYAPGGAPTHLGGNGSFNSAAPGNNMDDLGNTVVGDGGSDQNFGVVLAFDITETARDKIAGGGAVTLTGETILAGTVGSVDWSNLIVTVQAVGNSVDGTLGTSGPGFITQAAANLPGSDFDGVYDGAGAGDDAEAAYTIASDNLGAYFESDPTVNDKVKFTVDITSALASLPLSATVDRLMIGIWARVDGTGTEGTGLNGYVGSNNNAAGDRVAFKASAFTVRVLPPFALKTEPNLYGELVWDVTQMVKDWVNGVHPNEGLFVTVNKTKSWGEQVNFLTSETADANRGLPNPGDAAPLLRYGTAPSAPVAEGILAAPDFTVECGSQSGYYYQLQYSTNLSDWIDVGYSKPGTGGTLTFPRSAPASSGEKVFYRVVASLAP